MNINQVRKINKWKKKGYSIGVCNGCFDLLHPGHVYLIKKAKKKCKKLIVLINTDESVQKNKGNKRPIENHFLRKKKLLKLKEVDDVFFFGETTPLRIIKDIKPKFLFKGIEYKFKHISGRNFIKKNGGKVILIKKFKNFSTTSIIKQKNLKK